MRKPSHEIWEGKNSFPLRNFARNWYWSRTFPHHDFFTDGQGIGQENLFNVLKAYSL
jgi:hypothetical protein